MRCSETARSRALSLPAGGAEEIFTLYRRPGVPNADFQKDAAQIRRDLEKLKSLLE